MSQNGEILPTIELGSIPGWETLTPKSQRTIQAETLKLQQAVISAGKARLAIGEHLSVVQEALSNQRLFSEYLKFFNFRRSTAYSYIKGYKNASKWLPPIVMEHAMARGMNMIGDKEEEPLGVYTNAYRRLPPPNTQDPRRINTWLDSLEEARQRSAQRTRKKVEVLSYDEDVLLKEAFRFALLRLGKLPTRGKARVEFVHRLAGMLFSKVGVSGAQSVRPEAPPEAYIPVVGRPPIEANVA